MVKMIKNKKNEHSASGKSNIVILGAGFAGLRVAQELEKKLRRSDYKVILIDKEDVHIFTADLYEVSTAFNKKITPKCLIRLKESIATPIKKLINPNRVIFLKDTIVDIDPQQKRIILKKNGIIPYRYLVASLGSETNYCNIEGLKEHSLAMKTVKDGIKINCHIDQFFQSLWKKGSTREVTLTVGGGGASGTETIAELTGSIDRLAKKYDYPREKIKMQLIEGSNTLAGMDKKGTEIIEKRLKKLGIKVYLSHYITKVEKNFIMVKARKGERKLPTDILIWTGGVKVSDLIQRTLGDKEKKGAIVVNKYLQSKQYSDIFAAGDNAYFPDPEKKDCRVPMLAQNAIEEGKIIAKNILLALEGENGIEYKPKKEKYLIPLGGKYAILKIGDKILHGRWCWMLRRIVSLKYALQILPLKKAWCKWLKSNKIFVEND